AACGQRQEFGQELDRQGSNTNFAHLEVAFGSAAGDGSFSRGHSQAARGGTEVQEFLRQMATGTAESSAARDDGTSHHAADARVSQDCARRIHAIAGWKTALADGDPEISQTARTT